TSPLNPCRVANLSPHRAGSGFAPYRETPCWAHKLKRAEAPASVLFSDKNNKHLFSKQSV
ncbi:MAG: hypothetical protein KH037_11810, partial [Burkholderiales bacterium]|nr:hypothetical protein [Burkholderiales bacterium]